MTTPQIQQVRRGAWVLPMVLQAAAWPFARILLRVFCSLRVNGLPHLKGLPRGVIFAVNHGTELDPIIVRAALPFLSKHSPMFYVARHSAEYQWKGWRALVYRDGMFHAWGAYPAYRGTRNYGKSLRHFVELAEAGMPMTIFPTGIQRSTHTRGEPHGGVGYLAAMVGYSVVPVAIEGLYGLSWKSFLAGKLHVTVAFGKSMRAVPRGSVDTEPSVDMCRQFAGRVCNAIDAERVRIVKERATVPHKKALRPKPA